MRKTLSKKASAALALKGATCAAFSVATAIMVAATAPALAADAWPTHNIRAIIGATPGGAVDTVTRLLAAQLTQSLGQSVVPENRPGAATLIASDMVAKAKPDGYMFTVITGSFAVNAAVRSSQPFDPIKDFTPVTQVANLPDLLVVNPSLPVHSVKELVDYAKAHPGKLTFGSAGTGSETQLFGELFKLREGIDMLHVPYKAGVESVTGVVGGQVQVLFFNTIGVAGQVKAGRLRALAVTSARRISMFPQLPTLMEAGVPNYDTGSWYGVMLPANTPPAIVKRYNEEILKALKTPEVIKGLHTGGADIVGSSPEQFKKFIAAQIGLWQELVKNRPELKVTEK
jgi:tripartite-type tricarboxylate transporter receptor subunit TctC